MSATITGFQWGLVGGILIGFASAALLLFNGRIAGISNIIGSLIQGGRAGRLESSWRSFFVIGLFAGGWLFSNLIRPDFVPQMIASMPIIALAGVLVGFGSRLANGCTSGHGVCGIGRMSPRSLWATLTFTATGTLTVLIMRLLFTVANADAGDIP